MLALFGMVGAYVSTALGFALFPSAGLMQSGAAGQPPIYVCATLAHADIAVPLSDPLVDWHKSFPSAAAQGLPSNTYLAIGWGDLVFFRETPAWADVRVPVAAAALIGQHPVALRVLAVAPPDNEPDCMKVRVSKEGRKSMIQFILNSLEATSDRRGHELQSERRFEAFYFARGSYGPFRTCNQWVAEALASAGLAHAKFAPFSFSVTWPLEAAK